MSRTRKGLLMVFLLGFLGCSHTAQPKQITSRVESHESKSAEKDATEPLQKKSMPDDSTDGVVQGTFAPTDRFQGSSCLDVTAPRLLDDCQRLVEIDRELFEGDLKGGVEQLVALRNASLTSQAEVAALTQPRSIVDWVHRLVLARALLFSGSLSFGSGDEHNTAALRLLESLPLDSAPLSYRPRIRLDLGRSYLSLGQGDIALRIVEPLASEFPSNSEIQASFGVALLSMGRVRESLEPLRRARTLDPKEPERHLVLGTALMLLGELDLAEKAFRGGLSAASHRTSTEEASKELLARAYGDLGALRLLQGDAEGGRAFLQRAVGLAPRRATYLTNLSYAELLLNHAEEAEALALTAIRLDKTLVSAWLNLGLAQAQLKKWEEARSSFLTAQKLDPEDPRPKKNLEDLDELTVSAPTPERR